MGPYSKHVFVCTHGKTCPRQGSLEVHGELRRRVKEAGLADQIRINKTGCMAQCGYGPMLIVHPGDVWYGAVTVEAGVRILEEHIIGGTPVESLRYSSEHRGVRICPQGEEPIPPREEEAPGKAPVERSPDR